MWPHIIRMNVESCLREGQRMLLYLGCEQITFIEKYFYLDYTLWKKVYNDNFLVFIYTPCYHNIPEFCLTILKSCLCHS